MSAHRRWYTAALRGGLALAFATTLGASGLAQAEPDAFREFGKFAKGWMADMEKRERTHRSKPTIERSGGKTFATYTGYGKDFDVEVHATGDRSAPYVGVLHYKEQIYTCKDETTRSCKVKRSTPVTEVFPYRDGTWKY